MYKLTSDDDGAGDDYDKTRLWRLIQYEDDVLLSIIGIPIVKWRQSHNYLIFMMGIPNWYDCVFILNAPPCWLVWLHPWTVLYPVQEVDPVLAAPIHLVVRRAGLLWSQQDFEWRWSVPLFKCLTVSEFFFILFALCLLITFFNFIMNYVPSVTFWIFTYHKIWILSIMFCFIWSYWIIYLLACLEVSSRVVS